MTIHRIFRSDTARGALCALLCAAVLAGLLLPVLRRADAPMKDTIAQTPLAPITVFSGGAGMGADGSALSGGVEASSGSDEAAEETPKAEQEQSAQPEQTPDAEDTTRPEDAPEENMGAKTDAPQPKPTEEGGETAEDGADGEEPDLGLVVTWYKYGAEPKRFLCEAGKTVGKHILTAQLANGELRYALSLTGLDAENAKITQVLLARDAGRAAEVPLSGTLDASGEETRQYTFTVTATSERLSPDGETLEEESQFTAVLTLEVGLDLDLELSWQQADGTKASLFCAADGAAARTLKQTELPEGALEYSLRLVGEAAEESELLSAKYVSSSGARGNLALPAGRILLDVPEGETEQSYSITVTAGFGSGKAQRKVTYQLTLTVTAEPEVTLCFGWYANGSERRELLCEKDKSVSGVVKTTELAAGTLLYDMALHGEGAREAEITAVRYTSEGGGEGALSQSGSLSMALAEGQTSAVYTIVVTARVPSAAEESREVRYTVKLRFSGDAALRLSYTVFPGGTAETRSVTCENGKTRTAEPVYTDQLSDGLLSYSMTLTGEAAQTMRVTAVSCYQSGSGEEVALSAEGSVRLLTQGGKTGENTFAVTAEDDAGQKYRFTVNIPFRPRGEKRVKIETNLTDGMQVTNGTPVDLTVRAWSEDDEGGVISHILASGVDTELRVTLDGVAVSPGSVSGTAQQYVLLPENPEKGDENEHILYIYAADEYGNYGELTLTLPGARTQDGQPIGTAWMYIDLSVLGLGVYGPVEYTVLSGEAISISVAKAVWGYDAGEVFGTAEQTFGWSAGSCSYSGTLEEGFYLRALGDGSGLSSRAQALSGRNWSELGGNEAEVLAAIDACFGKGSGLASLWRCIYRNGLMLGTAPGGDSVGEFDFTSGSGWLYTLGGAFYPASSMSDYHLQDGQTLTLRYTLAYGWDVGGGSAGYGSTVGYCAHAGDGTITVSHEYEQVRAEDGTSRYVCRCCGLEAACAHEHTLWRDLEDGTCANFCEDCGEQLLAATAHEMRYTPDTDADTHTGTCERCGASESAAHEWSPGEDSATCLEGGSVASDCAVCGAHKEESTPPKGHSGQNVSYHNAREHWRQCQLCGEEIENSREEHLYVYDAAEEDWVCACGVLHGWDGCAEEASLTLVSASCRELVWHCAHCGLTLRQTGTFEEYHTYENGICTTCGDADPDYLPPQPDPEEPGGGEQPMPPETEIPEEPKEPEIPEE